MHFSLKFNLSDSWGSKMPSASSVLVEGRKTKQKTGSGRFWKGSGSI